MIRSLRGYLISDKGKFLKDYEEGRQEFREHSEAALKIVKNSKSADSVKKNQ